MFYASANLRFATEFVRTFPSGLAWLSYKPGFAYRAFFYEFNGRRAGQSCRFIDTGDFRNNLSAFSTYSMSPLYMSSDCMMSLLCNDALFTMVPERRTGSRLATGVTVPLRPTSNDTDFNFVRAFSALNLNATAQRGDFAV